MIILLSLNGLPYNLVHPFECRFVTFREALTLMGMPKDFCLANENPRRDTNHICQNVPVGTATDIVNEIVKFLTTKDYDLAEGDYVVQRKKQQDYCIRHACDSQLEEFF